MEILELDKSNKCPLSLKDIKDHIRIEHDEENEYLQILAKAAINMVESEVKKSLVQKTITITYKIPKLEGIPSASNSTGVSFVSGLDGVGTRVSDPDRILRGIKLPRGPVTSLTSVKTIDTDGVETALDTELYYFDDVAGKIVWKNQYWYDQDAIYLRVIYEAGYEYGNIPQDIKIATLIVLTDIYENRDSEVVYIPTKAQFLLRKHRPITYSG
jgi:hypothetical protein